MRLGEIKLQALSLMYPDTVIRYDDSDEGGISDAVYELKNNPNFEGILESVVGSINRALAHIESEGVSTKRCVDYALSVLERSPDGRVIITPGADFYSVVSVYCHKNGKTYACGYEIIDGRVFADYMSRGVYTLVYRTKIPRVKRTTNDSYRLELPLGACEAIPYFVVSELFESESSERAREARELFEGAINRVKRNDSSCHDCFQTVYSVVEQ